jgi:ABC-type transport system involved in cytochrome bd biosynthesis fused ATPase/permease subunit
MARRTARKSVERTRYHEYEQVANHFFEAARDAMELEYWTAAGVLIVHAAIAYADALCIQQAGVRSGADNHEEAIVLLEQALPASEGTSSAIKHLRRIIDEKTKVSYLGELYSRSQTKALWDHLDRFRLLAKKILQR